MQLNTQKPFAFQEKATNRRKTSLNIPKAFSINVKGVCISCGYRVQKVPRKKLWAKHKNGTLKLTDDGKKICIGLSQELEGCLRCAKRGMFGTMIRFPETLLPWQIDISKPNSAFICLSCGLRFFNYAVMGSLCSHKKHKVPQYTCRLYTCRLCCTKVDMENMQLDEEKLKKAGESIEIPLAPERLPQVDPFVNTDRRITRRMYAFNHSLSDINSISAPIMFDTRGFSTYGELVNTYGEAVAVIDNNFTPPEIHPSSYDIGYDDRDNELLFEDDEYNNPISEER